MEGRQHREAFFAKYGPYVIGLVICIVVPPFLPMYVQSVLTKVAVFAIFAMSLDLIMGYTGLLSLGHAAFFGVGGYMAAILMKNFEITNFWIVAPVSIIVAALFAAVLGLIALRVSGIYFLLVTFALSMLLSSYALKWKYVRGIYGMAGITPPDLGMALFKWNSISFYYFVLLVLIICYFLMHRVVNSPFGHALRGIRASESRMRALGYNTWLYKYIVFIIGGLFAGVAGVLFSYQSGVIAPQHLGVTVSTLAMLICIIGGLATLWGPVIGALVIIMVEYFSSLYVPERWPLVLGAVFVVAVMFLRGGMANYMSKLWKKIFFDGSIKNGSH
ncbi:MAG: branched-chain amino acid ABC transporter permease [Deltaproteobacteria bacterium]|nr:branched-chain amino acid ABC transporter permease [Deltaproteobacteria bacterium]